MGYFISSWNDHRRNYLLYFFLIIAYVFVGLTNATNTTVDNKVTLHDQLVTAANQSEQPTQSMTTITATTTTTTTTTTSAINRSVNATESTIFRQPRNMSDVQRIILALVQLLAQTFIIFGGVIPYIPQYLMIKRTQNASGFSNYVCLTLLVANIIRIEFWFGKRFEIPLLLQSIVMILCMLIMLEIWTRVHARQMQPSLPCDDLSISASKEQLTDEIYVKKFTDFEVTYFWRWTKFTSYLQFLVILTLILSLITWALIRNQVYIETIGFLAVFFEALLGVPQFIRNFRSGSTEGMSVKMVLLWASGDIFKTVYFVFRNAPKQFWICGILQISIDVAILGQVIIYSKQNRFLREQ